MRFNLLKKQNAASQLITNIVTMVVFVIVFMFFIDYYADMRIKDNLDQVARKYMLILETTNTINVNNISNDIRTAVGGWDKWEGQNATLKIEVVHKSTCPDMTPGLTQTLSASAGSVNTDIIAHYGDVVTITIEGNVRLRTTRWTGASVFHPEAMRYTHYKISKASTSKH